MSGDSEVPYWTRTDAVLGSNLVKSNLLFCSCSHYVVILLHKNNYRSSVLYFPKFCNHTFLDGRANRVSHMCV
jgi:hypothetical protein